MEHKTGNDAPKSDFSVETIVVELRKINGALSNMVNRFPNLGEYQKILGPVLEATILKAKEAQQVIAASSQDAVAQKSEELKTEEVPATNTPRLR